MSSVGNGTGDSALRGGNPGARSRGRILDPTWVVRGAPAIDGLSPAGAYAGAAMVGIVGAATVTMGLIALPAMLKRGEGYLLNTSSAAGLLTETGSAPYSVTT